MTPTQKQFSLNRAASQKRSPISISNRGLFFQWAVFVLFGIIGPSSRQLSAQEPSILSTTLAGNRIVVIPDANTPGTQSLVPGLPADAQPHGVAYFGSDHALVGDADRSRIFVVRISTATLLSTIDTTAVGYDGSGTIAVSPDQSVALALGGMFADGFMLRVIHAPFAPDSAITTVNLPGSIYQHQTQGIVFNSAGRAFIKHSGGVSVVDPPYTAVAFSFDPTNPGSGAIAITPDGNTLMTTCACSGINGSVVRIYTAPFSDSSTAVQLYFEAGNQLDGLAIAPDGASAIVVSATAHHAAAFTAPFFHSSPIETFTLPPGTGGFEDVGISADSQTAIITGNSTTEPAVLIRAPFTTAGAVLTNVPISGVTNSARGQGAVRFRPPLPTLKITSITRDTNNHILLQLSGTISGTPTIHASPDLTPNSFLSIGPATAIGPGLWEFDDADADGLTKRFYRATFP